MNNIIWYVLLAFFTQASCMNTNVDSNNNKSDVSDIDHYQTFLYYTWGSKLYDFHIRNFHDLYAKKLERFKNNYLMAAILYKHLNHCTAEQAARLAYRNTPSGVLALHTILYGEIDDFNEDDYRDTNLKSRWRDELEYIEQQINRPSSD